MWRTFFTFRDHDRFFSTFIMWRIFPLDIFSPHLSCGEISPRDRVSPPISCGEIFHLTDLFPHFSCGEISPCDRVSPHLSCGEIFHLTTCHGENFSTWPIFSPQTPSLVVVDSKRVLRLSHYFRPPNPNPNPTLDPYLPHTPTLYPLS